MRAGWGTIGYAGTAALTIRDRATVEFTNPRNATGVGIDPFGYVGGSGGAIGVIEVTGAGSSLSIASDTYIGVFGTGSLEYGPSDPRHAPYSLTVGAYGSGSLTISDGAAVSADYYTNVGRNRPHWGLSSGTPKVVNPFNYVPGGIRHSDFPLRDGTGVLNVPGTGSRFTGNTMNVGADTGGSGAVNITDGGEVEINTLNVAMVSETSGAVNVSAGSRLDVTWPDQISGGPGRIFVGPDGKLALANGGLATTSITTLWGDLSFNIGDDGTGAAASGLLETSTFILMNNSLFDLTVDSGIDLFNGDLFPLVDYDNWTGSTLFDYMVGGTALQLLDDSIYSTGGYDFLIDYSHIPPAKPEA